MDNEVGLLLKESYGFEAKNQKALKGYQARVWEVEGENAKKLIVKVLKDQSEKDLVHHQAEVAFSKAINSTGVINTLEFVADAQGNTIHPTGQEEDSYFVVFEPHEIIQKSKLTKEEQQALGHLMFIVHSKMADFSHPGLWTTNYMRVLDDKGWKLVKEAFPDAGYEPYLEYMRPLDYHALGLKTTTLHGDWHQSNISFTKPPFLFDLDTLCHGARVEEIARSITHWAIGPEQVKDFFENLVIGYGDLTEAEVAIIPKLAIAQQYRKYAEYYKYKDPEHMEQVKESIPILKSLFNLP